MGMTVQTRFDAGTLYVVAAGEFSLNDAKAMFLEVIGAIEQHVSCSTAGRSADN